MSPQPDHDLSRLYRSGAQEEPPPSLDQTILAFARDEVEAATEAPKRIDFKRWQASLALAAVLALAVSLTLMVDSELEKASFPDAPLARPDAPPRAPEAGVAQSRQKSLPEPSASMLGRDDAGNAAERAAVPKPAPRIGVPARPSEPETLYSAHEARKLSAEERRATEPARARQRREGEIETAPAAPLSDARSDSAAARAPPAETGAIKAEAPSAPTAGGEVEMPKRAEREGIAENAAAGSASKDAVVVPPPRPQAKPAPDRARMGRPIAKDESAHESGASVPSAAVPAPATAAVRVPMARAEGEQDGAADKAPEQWLRDIEKLRREGREAEARALLDVFRKRFPGHPLPESLK